MSRFVLASFLIIAATPTAATPQQTPAPTHSVQGAVRTVDIRGRALEVTTGVGMALRVVRVLVPPDVQVMAAGAPLPLSQLTPGDVVRVSYGGQAGNFRAYTIERIGRMATGLEVTP